MFRWIFGCLLAVSVNLFSSPLQERINRAKNGDYFVLEAGKMISILSIRSQTPYSLILEEVSIPLQNLKKKPACWSDWIRSKAPGHTSWSMIEIDRTNGEVLECYSFTRSSWVELSPQESFIATLIALPLKLIPLDERRKIGPAPTDGGTDNRKIWEPTVFVEGKKQEGLGFDVFETSWPEDKTPLSGHSVVLYFDNQGRIPLPVWIQLEAAHANFALRIIDIGKNFPSPYRKFPRRIPQFVGEPQKCKNGLRLCLKSPKYFRHFDLFAIDITDREKQLCPITYSLSEGKDEFLTLEIPEDELKQTLKADHRYTWLLVPTGHSDSYTETVKPFVWR